MQNMGFNGLYNTVQKLFALTPPLAFFGAFFINAPFGRFAPTGNSMFVFDGIRSWMIMEIFAPATFIISYFAPLLSRSKSSLSWTSPQNLLVSLFLIHYANRAILSPLRTPERSSSHAIIPFLGAIFNLMNGFLLGTYLSSPIAASHLTNAYSSTKFWISVSVWFAGFVGNVLHDEILLNLRRTKQKEDKKEVNGKPHYVIPYGYLYKYISYPNYLCEWIEWLGFAIASAPIPSSYIDASPPWLFLFGEVLTMFPRAYKGHQWYLSKFDNYPKERRVIIPFLV